MVAIMNEALELDVGQKVLEVGSGSGWHASTIAEIVAPTNVPTESWGHVYTTEIVANLAEFARRNVERAGFGDRVTIICCDGSEGYAEQAPYNRIVVTAAALRVPSPLKKQLKSGGVVLIPVGSVGFYQTLLRIRRKNNEYLEEDLGGVAFVPLVGKHGHQI